MRDAADVVEFATLETAGGWQKRAPTRQRRREAQILEASSLLQQAIALLLREQSRRGGARDLLLARAFLLMKEPEKAWQHAAVSIKAQLRLY